MKIRLKEDINIKDLMENDWEGCHSWTLDFLKQYYGEREIFEAEKVEKGSYRIYGTGIEGNSYEDYIEVNEKCFEELEKKKTKSLTKKDIEALGYACGEIQKCFTNGWTKSLENKQLEEEKKIPEKLDIVLLGQCDNWTQKYNKDTKEMENTHIELNPYIIDTIRENTLEIQHKFNEIIDYLKSKGE